MKKAIILVVMFYAVCVMAQPFPHSTFTALAPGVTLQTIAPRPTPSMLPSVHAPRYEPHQPNSEHPTEVPTATMTRRHYGIASFTPTMIGPTPPEMRPHPTPTP